MLVYLENQLEVALSLFGEAVSKAHVNLISVELRKEYISFSRIHHALCVCAEKKIPHLFQSLSLFSSTFWGEMNSEPFHYSNAN